MAKKQTRRSISVSRVTYERLRTYCETNGISMSQFVEARVGDFLGVPERSERVLLQRPVRPEVETITLTPRASVSAPLEELDEPTVRERAEPKPPRPLRPDQIFTF